MQRPKDEADALAAIAELDQLLSTRGLALEDTDHWPTALMKTENTTANGGITPKLALAMLIRDLRQHARDQANDDAQMELNDGRSCPVCGRD
jgi:hypothetical protein